VITDTIIQTQVQTATETITTTQIAIPTPYASLDVFERENCVINELLLGPDAQMILRAGECKNITSATDDLESIVSERLSKVFDQPTCQICSLTVFTEYDCAGASAIVPLAAGERTACSDGTLHNWAETGGDEQAVSYRLDCA
jgi:hypothetical protein